MTIYIVTAFYGDFFDELTEMAQSGVDFEVLQKPLEMDQIINAVRGALEGPVAYEYSEKGAFGSD